MSHDGSTDPIETEDRPKVVFFVDDDDGVRHLTTRLLERRGYEVISAASAAEATEVLEAWEGRIDVLLMDLVLPDGWGATLAHRLQEARPDMALVYTTGFAEVDSILSGGLGTADFVVTKPFTSDELVDELERAMAANS